MLGPFLINVVSRYCVFVGGYLVYCKSKKQEVMAKSSVKAKYYVITLVTCELIWIKQLIEELKFA